MSENIYGIHAVNSILANSPERLIEVFVLKGREDKRLQPLLNELYALGIAVQFVNRQTLDKKSNGEVHQGVIARVQEAKELNEIGRASCRERGLISVGGVFLRYKHITGRRRSPAALGGVKGSRRGGKAEGVSLH